MSGNADEAGSAALPKPLRTVTPSSRTRPNQGMDSIGWGILLGLLVLLVPLLPFICIVWLISKVTEALAPS